MKQVIIAVAVLTIAFVGCKKDTTPPPEEPRAPSEIMNAVVDNLKTADSISVFVDALKGLPLSAADVEDGITVFAPLNGEEAQAQQQALTMDTKRSIQVFETEDLTPTVLRDHIVKGVFRLADLTDGRVLISLSGKELKISREGNRIWINGILIGSEEIGPTVDQIVYTVKELLSGTSVDDELQTTSLEVVVWDAMGWTPELEKGTRAVGAQVRLYQSQADYANDIVGYEAETDTEGKAVFSDMVPGEYFIVVKHGEKRNLFHDSMQGGVYVGMVAVGIFQSVEDVDAAPLQQGGDGLPGNFQWMDTNADGVINSDDRVTIPHEKAEVKDGRVKTTEVWIGYGNNAPHRPLPPEEFVEQLRGQLISIDGWRMRLAVMDAVLSGDIPSYMINGHLASDYGPLVDFSFLPTTSSITRVWFEGYQRIGDLNLLAPRTDDPVLSARLRLARAYVYLQLMTYFENIPLSQEVGSGSLNNSDPDIAYNFVKRELEEIERIIPEDGGRVDGSKAAVRTLIARTALLRKDYNLAATHIDRIINAGNYRLSPLADKFDVLSPEYIWNQIHGYSQEMAALFFDRPSFPMLRYSEVLFAGVEAKLGLGEKATAVAYYNQLIERDGWTPIDNSISTEELTTRLRSNRNSEMSREGTTFANYVRWGVAVDSLGHRGFHPHQNRLPIPQQVIDSNPQMKQNGGY